MLQNLVGQQNARHGIIKIFNALQETRANKHLLYVSNVRPSRGLLLSLYTLFSHKISVVFIIHVPCSSDPVSAASLCVCYYPWWQGERNTGPGGELSSSSHGLLRDLGHLHAAGFSCQQPAVSKATVCHRPHRQRGWWCGFTGHETAVDALSSRTTPA